MEVTDYMKLEDRAHEFDMKLKDVASLYADTLAFANAHKENIDKFKRLEEIDYGDVHYLLWRGLEDGTLLLQDNYYSKSPLLASLDANYDTRTSLHSHNYIELGYIYKGSFKQCIVDKIYEFVEGDFILIDSNTKHYDILKGTDNFIVFFMISESFFDSMFLKNIQEGPLKKVILSVINGQKSSRQFVHFKDHEKIEMVNIIIDQLLDEIEHKLNGWKYIVKGLMSRLMTILSLSYRNSLSSFDQNQINTMLFEEISKYIDIHYRTISIEDLVNHYHYNTDYYNRLIKKNTGLTYSQYVQKLRIEKAKELMIQTDKSIEEIIHFVGYKSNGFFYKIFYKNEGRTPQEFRENEYK